MVAGSAFAQDQQGQSAGAGSAGSGTAYAAIALLSNPTIPEAAKACKVGEATLWRWLQVPEFQSRFRAARRQLVEAALAQLQNDCTKAARVLREIAEDKTSPASARVSAAKTILEQSLEAVKVIDLEERLALLEEVISKQKRGAA